MGSVVREWVGFQQFPAATQEKLIEFFGKLKQKDMNSLTVLVLGKGGVGKSSTVNSLIGEQVVRVSPFQAEGLRPVMVSRTMGGFTINIIDTPGLVEAGYVNHQALELIKGFLVNRTIDVLLYVDRLDVYRVDELDRQVVQAITQTFGKEIWCKTLLVLTHAQFSPPDELSYETFSSKRSDSLLKTIRAGSKMRKQQFEDSAIEVVYAENSGRCSKNEKEEKLRQLRDTIDHSNTKGGEMNKYQKVGLDSEDDSDDYDIVAEANCELAMLEGQLCSIPYELYDLPDLTGILSVETWNSFLTEEERFFMSCYLPDMEQDTFSLTMQELLGGANLCFGNPVDKFYMKLKGGLFTRKVACYDEGVMFVKRKMYLLLFKVLSPKIDQDIHRDAKVVGSVWKRIGQLRKTPPPLV